MFRPGVYASCGLFPPGPRPFHSGHAVSSTLPPSASIKIRPSAAPGVKVAPPGVSALSDPRLSSLVFSMITLASVFPAGREFSFVPLHRVPYRPVVSEPPAGQSPSLTLFI